MVAPERGHEQKSLTIRRAIRVRSIHTATVRAGSVGRARQGHRQTTFLRGNVPENGAEEPPPPGDQWLKSPLYDLSRDWCMWSDVGGCSVRGGMSYTPGGQKSTEIVFSLLGASPD